MTPYHKIMKSIVAHGYVHEWRFGDRAWHNNREWVAVSVHSGGTKIYLWSEHGNTTIITQQGGTPLPTVEQWKDLFIKSGYELKVICLVDGLIRLTVEDMTKMNTKPIKEGCFDLHIGLAILYARVALNLKWNEEKGEFER